MTPARSALQHRLELLWEHYLKEQDEGLRHQQFSLLLPAFLRLFEESSNFADLFPQHNEFCFFVARRFASLVSVHAAGAAETPLSDSTDADPPFLVFISSKSTAEFVSTLMLLAADERNVNAICQTSLPSIMVASLTHLIDRVVGDAPDDPVSRYFRLLEKLTPSIACLEDFVRNASLQLLVDYLLRPYSLKEYTLRILTGTFKHHMTADVVDMLGDIAIIPQLLTRVANFSSPPSETIGYCCAIGSWLNSSIRISPKLLDQFNEARGYDVFYQCLLWLESHHPEAHLSDSLLETITELCYVGFSPIEDSHLLNSPFYSPVQTPVGSGSEHNSVRNLQAFQIFQSYFISSTRDDRKARVLDCILGIYAANYKNFMLLQQLHTLAHFFESFRTNLSLDIQEGVLRVLIFVVTVINCIPFVELSALSLTLQDSPPVETTLLIVDTVTKIIYYDAKYKTILQEAGLLLILVSLIRGFHHDLFPSDNPPALGHVNTLCLPEATLPVYHAIMACLTSLLDGCRDNAKHLRTPEIIQMLFSFGTAAPALRASALPLLQQIFIHDACHDHGDLSVVLEYLLALPCALLDVKIDFLRLVCRLLHGNPEMKDLFLELGGFMYIVSLLPQLPLAQCAFPLRLQMLEALLLTLTIAITDHERNKLVFKDYVLFSLTESLALAKIFVDLTPAQEIQVLNALFAIAIDTPVAATLPFLFQQQHPEKIATPKVGRRQSAFSPPGSRKSLPDVSPNPVEQSTASSPRPFEIDFTKPLRLPEMFAVVVYLLSLHVKSPATERYASAVVDAYLTSCASTNVTNATGVISFILRHFSALITAPSSFETSHVSLKLLQIVETLGVQMVSAGELRQLLKLCQATANNAVRERLLETLLHMSSSSNHSIPVLDFDLSSKGYAFVNIPALNLEAWPPANGYSFMCWLYITRFDPDDPQAIQLFCLQSDDRRCYQRIGIDNRSRKLFFLTQCPELTVTTRESRKNTASSGLFSALSNSLSSLSNVANVVSSTHLSATLNPKAGASASTVGTPNEARSDAMVPFDFVFQPQQWYHVCLVHHKNRFQSSEARLYVNGEFNSSVKHLYPNPAAGNVHNCTIGTINNQTHASNQAWMLGPTYLLQDPLPAHSVFLVYLLGPHYFGNFQGALAQYQTYSIFTSHNRAIARAVAPQSPLANLDISLCTLGFPESSFVFSLAAHNHLPGDFETASDRHSEFDSVTLVNAADLTSSTLMFLDGGIKARTPQTVPLVLQEIGGLALLFRLVEQSESPKSLNLAIELILATYNTSWIHVRDLESCNGYHTLGFLLKRKSGSVDARTVELIYNVCGLRLVQPGDLVTGILANYPAFQALICDFGVWRHTSPQLKLYFFVLLLNLVGELPSSLQTDDTVSDLGFNCQRLLEHGFLSWLLLRMLDPDVPKDILTLIPQIIQHLLQSHFSIEHAQTLADFIATTLPASDHDAMEPPDISTPATNLSDGAGSSKFGFLCRVINARNLILEAILSLLNPDSIRIFSEVMNPKWMLMIFMPNLNENTIFLALKIMAILYQAPSSSFAIDWRNCHGWRLLELNLPHYCRSEKIYMLLLSLLVGRCVLESFDQNVPFDLPNLCAHFQPLKQMIHTPQVLSVLLAMLKAGCQFLCDARDPNAEAQPVLPTEDSHPNVPEAHDDAEPLPLMNNDLPSSSSSSSSSSSTTTSGSSGSFSLNQQNNQLLCLQHSLIGYLIHLFPLSTDFQFAFHHKNGSLMRSLVHILFPHGVLWYLITPFSLETAQLAGIASPRAPRSDSTTIERSASFGRSTFVTSELVLDFIRLILHTALLHSKNAIAILELTLESVMASTDFFQSKVLFDLIAFYSSKRLPAQFLNSPTWLSNIGKFANLLVDKVEQEVFLQGESIAFDFLIHLLQVLFEAVELPGSLDQVTFKTHVVPIYRSLNRLVLRLVDRSFSTQARDADAFVHTLNRIIDEQAIILNPANTDAEFISSLCHLLFKLALDDNKNIRITAMNIWKLLLLTKSTLMDHLLIQRVIVQQSEETSETVVIDLKTDGFDMLLSMDYNAFFNWLTNSLPTIRRVFDITLTPVWVNYHSVQLAGRTAQSKHFRAKQLHWQQHNENRNRKHQQLKSQQYLMLYKTLSQLNSKDSIQHKLLRCQQQELFSYESLSAHWNLLVEDTSRERAAWGDQQASHIAKWKLSLSEGPARMQKLFEPNYSFFIDYPPDNPYQASYSTMSADVAQHGFSDRKMIPTSLDAYEYLQIHAKGPTDDNVVPVMPQPELTRSISPILPIFTLPEFPTPQTLHDIAATPDAVGLDSEYEISFSGGESSELDGPSSEDFLDSLDSMHSTANVLNDSFQADPQDPHGSTAMPDLGDESANNPLPPIPADKSGGDAEGEGLHDQGFLSDRLEENLSSTLLPQAYTQQQRNQHKVQMLAQNDPDDKVNSIFNAGIIVGMDRHPGLFVISRYRCTFLPFYIINSIGEIVEDRAAMLEHHPQQRVQITPKYWVFSDIVSVQPRLYLLQRIALELFLANAETSLLVFDSHCYAIVLKQMTSAIKGGGAGCESLLLGGTGLGIITLSEIEQGVKKSLALRARPATISPGNTSVSLLNVPGVAVMTQRWQEGRISNFHYLMYLNTLASRSYNDLSQYPVFPWVLADYDSPTLDLEHPATFRDLSKPMGALSEPRASAFRVRYDSWEPLENDNVPKFHYGCHYSSAGIVLHFLFRLEPFTHQFLKLMGGQFDHPDRLFHSLSETYQNAAGVQTSGFNMADVKESIPALYYLPEIFLNQNRFDFGARQSGEVIFDAVLPPWAYQDPYEFIVRHRQALESDYVSQHLHQWIDLIFGARQRGPEAEHAQNVFYFLTYEGAVDIDSIRDPTERNAVIAQINNFGQTPLQLFDRPHPPRLVLPSELRQEPTLFVNEQGDTECSSFLEMNTGRPVSTILLANEALLTFAPHRKPIPPLYSRYVAWGYPDRSLRIFSVTDHDRPIYILEAPHGIHHVSAVAFSCDGRFMAVGGYDSVVSLYQVESDELSQLPLHAADFTPSLATKRSGIRLRLLKRFYGHVGPVSSLCIASSWNIIVSGSVDRTCIVWHLHSHRYIRHLETKTNTFVSAIVVNEASGEIVVASGVVLTIWSLNGQLLASKTTQDLITAITIAHREDYEDRLKLYITGHQSGYIRVWRISSYVTTNGPPVVPEPSLPPALALDGGFSQSSAVLAPSPGATPVPDEPLNATLDGDFIKADEFEPEPALLTSELSFGSSSFGSISILSRSSSKLPDSPKFGSPLSSPASPLLRARDASSRSASHASLPDVSATFSLVRELALVTQIHAHPAPLTALYLRSDGYVLYSADLKGTVVRHERKIMSPPEPQIVDHQSMN